MKSSYSIMLVLLLSIMVDCVGMQHIIKSSQRKHITLQNLMKTSYSKKSSQEITLNKNNVLTNTIKRKMDPLSKIFLGLNIPIASVAIMGMGAFGMVEPNVFYLLLSDFAVPSVLSIASILHRQKLDGFFKQREMNEQEVKRSNTLRTMQNLIDVPACIANGLIGCYYCAVGLHVGEPILLLYGSLCIMNLAKIFIDPV